MSEPRYISVREASRYLGICQNTLRGWIRRRKIPFLKVVGRVLLDRQTLDRWLLDHAVQSEDAVQKEGTLKDGDECK
jgi:excisionase family DNA binding protein